MIDEKATVPHHPAWWRAYHGVEETGECSGILPGDIAGQVETNTGEAITSGGPFTFGMAFSTSVRWKLRKVTPETHQGCTFREALDAWRAKDERLEFDDVGEAENKNWVPFEHGWNQPLLFVAWQDDQVRLRPAEVVVDPPQCPHGYPSGNCPDCEALLERVIDEQTEMWRADRYRRHVAEVVEKVYVFDRWANGVLMAEGFRVTAESLDAAKDLAAEFLLPDELQDTLKLRCIEPEELHGDMTASECERLCAVPGGVEWRAGWDREWQWGATFDWAYNVDDWRRGCYREHEAKAAPLPSALEAMTADRDECRRKYARAHEDFIMSALRVQRLETELGRASE